MPAIKITKKQEKYIIKEYGNGKGKFANEIARELGVYRQVVTNCLRRNNINVIKRWNPARGERNGNYHGGIRMIKGYRHIFIPDHHLARKDGWVAEHRILMENKLGRNLKKNEIVHHKDENKINNEEKNLEVYKNNGKHLSGHSLFWKRDKKGKWFK